MAGNRPASTSAAEAVGRGWRWGACLDCFFDPTGATPREDRLEQGTIRGVAGLPAQARGRNSSLRGPPIARPRSADGLARIALHIAEVRAASAARVDFARGAVRRASRQVQIAADSPAIQAFVAEVLTEVRGGTAHHAGAARSPHLRSPASGQRVGSSRGPRVREGVWAHCPRGTEIRARARGAPQRPSEVSPTVLSQATRSFCIALPTTAIKTR